MLILPKINPLYENIPAGKIAPSLVLDKLAKGGFTGYFNHSAAGMEAHCIFAKGKLICSAACDNGSIRKGPEALSCIFTTIRATGGEINVYRLSDDLAMCSYSLLLGNRVYDSVLVRETDMKSIFAQLRNRKLNGAVHFHTSDQSALLFYKDGQHIGFYRKGERALEASPEESRKVAALPGACFDVCSTQPLDELLQHDVLQAVNLDQLWLEAQGSEAVQVAKKPVPPTDIKLEPGNERLDNLLEDLKEVAAAYLSKEGRNILSNIIEKAGGPPILLDKNKTEMFISQFEVEARNFDSHARIDEMIDLMKSEIASLQSA